MNSVKNSIITYLYETINIIAKYVYSENSRCTPPFSQAVFIKLLKIATGGTFCHNDKLFKQVDGVAMGNPLGPTDPVNFRHIYTFGTK